MNKENSKKLLAIQEAAMADESYQALIGEHGIRNKRFLAVMETLSKEQQAEIYAYLGVLVQMHYRLMELACK